tara:strand:- start:623 stop:1201 length:579 start_codon:yes stop_codon:yes gene_type:complete
MNIVLFGMPGSGKGTQANFIKIKYNLTHISTGDVFRENIKNNTKLGKLAKSYLDSGKLVPDKLTIKLLEKKIEENIDSKGYIFDGFPRTIDQGIHLDNFLLKKHLKINLTISLEVDKLILIDRILKRGLESRRIDDQSESKIEKRFEEYNQKTSILKEFYARQNKFFSINGQGSINEVKNRLIMLIDKHKND